MKGKINYKGVWIFSLVLMLSVCIFSYVRVTYADFNGLTGQIGKMRQVSYYSNYPEEINSTEGIHTYMDLIHSSYFIEEIMFKAPSGYVFYAWNTFRDGSGDFYQVGKFYKMEENLTLYAIWGKNLLGDINLDGKVDKEDYVLLSKHIGDTSFLTGIVLSNADVNLDGKIDLVDVDIIKQAILGTSGYTQLLSNNPVFIYEIYKENNNSGNGTGSGGGNGTGNGSSNGSGNDSGNSNNDGDNNADNDSGLNNGNNPTNGDNSLGNIDNVVNKSDDNNEYDKKTLGKYLNIFLIGLLFISFRIIINIIKRAKHKHISDK